MTASRVWHAALAVMVCAALLVQLVLVLNGGADANSGGIAAGTPSLSRVIALLSYFTIQSNILVAAAGVGLALDPARDGRAWRVLRLDALLGIAITGLVFSAVLAPEVHLSGAALWCTIVFHYVAPPAYVLGWLVFGPRGRLDRASMLWAFGWPAAWIGYTLAHGAETGWYPYPFLNVTTLGYAHALRNIAFVVVLAVLALLVFAWLDRVLPGPRGRDGAHEAAAPVRLQP